MAAPTSEYHDVYGEVDLLDHQFRLFRLQRLPDGAAGRPATTSPTESDTRLTCELAVFSLAQQPLPDYTAVSYRWGTDEEVFPIEINGQAFMVRDNLHNFLLQMASENSPDWFFVDAICINQNDGTEKASQVKLMGAIYKNAASVLVWISPEPGQEPEEDEPALLQAVSRNRFWTRLWIVQEVILARRLVVRLGCRDVKWWNIVNKNAGMLHVDKEHRPLRPPVENFFHGFSSHQGIGDSEVTARAVQILSWRDGPWLFDQGHRLPFWKAILFFSSQSCTKFHDKIFGLLGIAESRIQPDYSMTVLDLFIATLADFCLSLGFIATEASPGLWRRSWQMLRACIKQDVTGSEWLAPMTIFNLDPFHPVVSLCTFEVGKYFAPGWEKMIQGMLLQDWHTLIENKPPDRWIHDMGSWGSRTQELGFTASFKSDIQKKAASRDALTSTWKQLERLREDDAEIDAPGGIRQTRTYQQWAAHTTAICDDIWSRYQQSGEATSSLEDDEDWTLVA